MAVQEQAPRPDARRGQEITQLYLSLLDPANRRGLFATPHTRREGVFAQRDEQSYLQRRIDAFLDRVGPEERELLTLAVTAGARLHEGQYREDAITPYFVHPLGVADQLLEQREDGIEVTTEMLTDALLHDTLEDWDGTLQEFETVFTETFAGSTIDREQVQRLQDRTRIYNKHAYPPDTYLEHIAAEGGGAVKAHDRLNSAESDLRKVLVALGDPAQDSEALKARLSRSGVKLKQMRWFRESVPEAVMDKVELVISAIGIALQAPQAEQARDPHEVVRFLATA